MNVKRVQRHLMAFDLKGRIPPELVILQELYGLKAAEIATAINRSTNQMTYYKNGTTPLPTIVRERLHRLLKEMVLVVDQLKVETPEADDLMSAISAMTYRVLEATPSATANGHGVTSSKRKLGIASLPGR